MTKRAFGELESQILYILRSQEKWTIKEVHQSLGGKDNYNTIMTVMSRLAEKGVLLRERMGHHYEYWLSKPTGSFSFLDKIKHKFVGIKTTALVSHLIETADDISDEDLAEMEQALQKIRDARK